MHKVLRTETALEVMSKIAQELGARFQDAVTKALIGSVVMARYNNETYRVDDIHFDMNPRSSLTHSRGETLRFADYYLRDL